MDPSFFLCEDESNYYYLFAENNYYNKFPNEHENNAISSLNIHKTFYSGIHFCGFIKDKEYSEHGTEKGTICSIQKNEIIIYGKKENYIYFRYIKEDNPYLLEVGNIKDIISCKYIKEGIYICAYFILNLIKVDIIAHNYIENGMKGFSKLKAISLDNFIDFDNLVLYETKKEYYKILCASKKETNEIKCTGIYSQAHHDIEKDLYLNAIELQNTLDVSLSQSHQCYLSGFNSEFLLCCENNDKINCFRNNITNFELINKFVINLSGPINNILITNKTDHVIISYKNQEDFR